MSSLDWWNYHGEPLCPRCGVGAESGDRYKVCAEYADVDSNGYQVRWNGGPKSDWLIVDHLSPHEMACERYNYGDLCAKCEAALGDG